MSERREYANERAIVRETKKKKRVKQNGGGAGIGGGGGVSPYPRWTRIRKSRIISWCERLREPSSRYSASRRCVFRCE